MEEIPATNLEIPTPKPTPGPFIVFSLIFLIVGIFLGYALAIYLPQFDFFTEQSPSPKVTCTPRPACLDTEPRCLIPETPDMCPPTINPTPSIQSVTGERNDYRLRIPGDWKRTEGVAGSFTAPDGSSIAISISEADTDSLADYLTSLDKLTSTSWEGKPGKKVISSKPVTVAGLPGIERVEEFLAADLITLITYTLVNGQVYSFYIVPLELPYDQTTAYSAYFDILASFEPISSVSN